MARLKIVSLFCGCGGMDLGALGGFNFLGKEYTRHNTEIVYAADFDEYCTQIYNENFEHKCLVKDVRDIKMEEIPDCDILMGGFPCQSFSISAQNPPRLGYKDERGMLFFEMVKILKAKQPRFFIAENVKGLLSANKGKAFPMILKEFESAGYKIVYKLLNASEYGVPQKRERVIIVGFRDEEDIAKFRYPNKVKLADRKVLGDVLVEDENRNERLFFSERAVAGMMAVREKMNKGRAMNVNEPCNTISAHLAKVSLNSTDPVFMVDGRYRRFSTREAARIQSFPDAFKLEVVSQGRQYKAIGNAVPPVLMWNVMKQIQSVVSNKTKTVRVSNDTLELNDSFSSGNWVQLSFLDMLDQLEGVNSEVMMVREDEPVGYGRYRATMYQTNLHEKFYIARGNVFDVESFWADGVAAFVKGGFNNISASYDEFKATPHEGVHVVEYLYNNPGTTDPTPENVNDLVADALNSLVEKGAKVVTMPPINIVGVKAEVKDALTAQAIVAWLKDNGEKINRLIIVDKEA